MEATLCNQGASGNTDGRFNKCGKEYENIGLLQNDPVLQSQQRLVKNYEKEIAKFETQLENIFKNNPSLRPWSSTKFACHYSSISTNNQTRRVYASRPHSITRE